jgi:hypothetical protein
VGDSRAAAAQGNGRQGKALKTANTFGGKNFFSPEGIDDTQSISTCIGACMVNMNVHVQQHKDQASAWWSRNAEKAWDRQHNPGQPFLAQTMQHNNSNGI